jgi:hypothetical protein
MANMMETISFDVAAVLSLAFGAAGLVQLVGPGFVRRAYHRWEFRPQFHRAIAVLQLQAACLLVIPHTRFWGFLLAGLLNFFSVVMLLKNREYGWALPGIAAQLVLAPALFAAANAQGI